MSSSDIDSHKCPYCGSHNVVFNYIDSTYVCANCGSVIDKELYYGIETRPFDNTTPRTSGSHTYLVHDRGIGGTVVDVERLNPVDRYKWSNIAKEAVETRVSKKDRVVEKALRYLNTFAKNLEIPDYARETAAKYLRNAVVGKNYKDKTLKNLALGAIYVALKLHGFPKSAKQFAKENNMQLSKLWEAIRLIKETNKGLNESVKNDIPENYIPQIISKLGLSPNVKKLSYKMIQHIRELDILHGKPAVGWAVAAVYLSSILLNEKRTQLQIAESVGVSDVMIRNRYSDIIENLDITVYI